MNSKTRAVVSLGYRSFFWQRAVLNLETCYWQRAGQSLTTDLSAENKSLLQVLIPKQDHLYHVCPKAQGTSEKGC